ncbi:hypothetical protein MICAI_1930005 [Microcystis sp. T1-4]|nr:hypothetical protein MICAI_1930005 [Microcystis sp. T1-4]
MIQQRPAEKVFPEEKKPAPNADDNEKRDRLAQLNEIIFMG